MTLPTDDELVAFMRKHGGVASVTELADFIELDEGYVRRWARKNDVRRIGATFCFSLDLARAFVVSRQLEPVTNGALKMSLKLPEGCYFVESSQNRTRNVQVEVPQRSRGHVAKLFWRWSDLIESLSE